MKSTNKAVKTGNSYVGKAAKKKTVKSAKQAAKTHKEITKKAVKQAAKQAKEVAQKSARATKATVKITVKVAQMVVAASKAIVSALAVLGGWAVLLVALIVVIVVAAIAARMKINCDDYSEIIAELKSKISERRQKRDEKAKTPPIKIFKHKELTQTINELSEQIEELRIEKNTILANLNTNDIQTVKNKIADIQKVVPVMERQPNGSKTRFDSVQKEYAELKEQAQKFDIDEIYDLCRNIRPQVEYGTEAELYEIYGVSFSRGIFNTAKSETDNSIDGSEIYSVRRQFENHKQRQNEQKHENHQFSHDDEDELEL